MNVQAKATNNPFVRACLTVMTVADEELGKSGTSWVWTESEHYSYFGTLVPVVINDGRCIGKPVHGSSTMLASIAHKAKHYYRSFDQGQQTQSLASKRTRGIFDSDHSPVLLILSSISVQFCIGLVYLDDDFPRGFYDLDFRTMECEL